MNRVHMMRVWKMDMGEVMERIPKVELTGLVIYVRFQI